MGKLFIIGRRGAEHVLRLPEGRPNIYDRAHETYYHLLVVLSNDYSMETAPPDAVARVNLCVLWVGSQLSLLGGKRPIATTRCDRRRATIDSCA